MNFANLGIGIILAFVNSWAITLLIAAFIPVMILSGILQTKLLTGFAGKDKKSLEDAGKVNLYY
jgi:ATP-binding cassette, subfamily B (MDR/TAP), member 1